MINVHQLNEKYVSCAPIFCRKIFGYPKIPAVFCILQMLKLGLYIWYLETLPDFGNVNVELHYMGTDCSVFSFAPIQGFLNDLTHFSTDLDLSETSPAHQLYSEDNKKVIGKMKLESYQETQLDEAVFLGSKSYLIQKKSNPTETNFDGVQTQNGYILEDKKSCLEKKLKTFIELGIPLKL